MESKPDSGFIRARKPNVIQLEMSW